MTIKLLSPLWGHEHLRLESFLHKIRRAGFDGIDTWVPEDKADKKLLFDYMQRHEMCIVTHQFRADGSTFRRFRSSFVSNLRECAEPGPLLINSHTGRDWFSMDQNLALADAAQEFSEKSGVMVVHETHR